MTELPDADLDVRRRGLSLAYVYILVSLLLYCVTIVSLPVGPEYLVSHGREERLLTDGGTIALLLLLCFCALFAVHSKIYRVVNGRTFALTAALVIFVYITAVPFFDGDVFLYLFKGLILSEYGVSPYAFCQAFETPYQFLSVWIFTPVAYGPLSVLLFSIAHFAEASPYLNMYVMKLIFLALYVVMAWVGMKRVSGPNVYFLLLSPLVLIETFHSPHVDMVSLVFLVLGFVAIREDRVPLCFVFLGLAAAVKVSSLAFLLPVALHVAKFDRRRLTWCVSSLLIAFGPVFLVGSPRQYLAALLFEAQKDGFSVLRLFNHSLIAQVVVIALCVAYLCYVTGRFWRLQIDVFRLAYLVYLAYMLASRSFQPWHVLPLYAPQLFFDKLHFDYLGLIVMVGVYPVYFIFGAWTPLQGMLSSGVVVTGLILSLIVETPWRIRT